MTDTLSLAADYTNLSATDLMTGLALARRPRDSASGTITWLPLPNLTLGASVVYMGRPLRRFRELHAARRQHDHQPVRLLCGLPTGLSSMPRVENLFDELNEPVLGYGRTGRAAYGGVRTVF